MALDQFDRLTRSLADFAKFVELFDAHKVAFVSVTQAFNTTSSMGRLTLNMLLRAIRARADRRARARQIAVPKRKGLWVGGPVPLSYRCLSKMLAIVPEEAETVRLIFSCYLELGSIGALIGELARRGIRTKACRLAGGGILPLWHGITRLSASSISARWFTAARYTGASMSLFSAGTCSKRCRKGSPPAPPRGESGCTSALLTGRIFDDRGNRISPTHANKRGVRYRYYVSHALLQKQTAKAGAVARVPAPGIEALVLKGVRQQLAPAMTDRELIDRHVVRVILKPQEVEVRLVPLSGAAAAAHSE